MPLWARYRWGLAAVAALGMAAACGAQEGRVVPSTPGKPYTLHVYENRVQVPTLVLDRLHAMEAGLSAADFMVSLDAGPRFHPLQVRVEGDDPLTIAVLIDASSAVGPEMLANFRLGLASLADGLLTGRDHVSVYAMDCALVRSTKVDVPASKEALDRAVGDVLESTTLHGEFKLGMGCDGSRRLRDGMVMVARQMGSLPGRRVMLVVSDGEDRSSVNGWEGVREYLNSLDVTVFGIRSDAQLLPTQKLVKSGPNSVVLVAEDPFGSVCGGTGGLALDANANTVGSQVERAFRLVRGRYILEFQRPVNAVAGIHTIDVTVPDQTAIVRPGGVLVKLEDPGLAKDPSVVQSDQSRAPQFGTRKASSKPQ